MRSQALYSGRTGLRSNSVRSRLLHGSLLALSAASAPAAANAQSATSSVREANQSTAQLEEIVVTAQHRSERLQDVPIAVTSLSAAALSQQGVSSTSDLAQATPSLIFNSQVGGASPYIRGVGSDLFDPTSEAAVAIYVDDVYMAAALANLFSLKGVKQIDVLNGPQGTLFGRNATGGVIQVQTLEPTQEPHLDFAVTYGNYDYVSASVYASTGLSDAVSTSISALYEDQGQGYGRNFFDGSEINKQAIGNISVRNKWKFDLSDATIVHVSADYSDIANTISYQRIAGSSSPLPGASEPIGYPGKFNANINQPDSLSVKSGGVSLKVDHDFGWGNLTSISAYRKLRSVYGLDQDQTDLPVIDILWNTRFRNVSQELRIAGQGDAALSWMVGAFYYNARGSYDDFAVNGTVYVPFDQQRTESLAGFAQATVEVLPGLKLTGGARYTWEKQRFFFPAGGLTDSQSVKKPTFRVALDYKFTPDILGYVSFNTGFKSGGYNLLQPGGKFDPEKLTSYEAGLKTELFNRKLRLNINGFYYDYTNQQVNVSEFGGNVVDNAAGSRIKGFEANFDYVPTARLKLSGALSIMDGHYTDYFNYQPRDANGNNIGGPVNAKGETTARTPKFVGNMSARYSLPTQIGEIVTSLGVQYNDGYYWVADKRLRQHSYTLINGSISWTPGDGPLDIRLWGKNLLDKYYFVIAGPSATPVGDNQVPAAPRTFGATLSYRY